MGIFPKLGVDMKNIWNHHLDLYPLEVTLTSYPSQFNQFPLFGTHLPTVE